MSGGERGGSRMRLAVALGLVLLATSLVYAPALRNGFTYDDKYIAKAEYAPGRPNPMIQQLQSPREYFTSHYWRGWREVAIEYRPITILSYALTYRVLGRSLARTPLGEAFPQHLLNLLLHLLAVALSFQLLRAARAPTGAALAGALVFGLHAVHSEVVASVIGRAELLAYVFGSAAVLLALESGQASSGRSWILRVGAGLLFFLAFCSKESAVAWSGLLLLMLWLRAREGRASGWRGRWLLPGVAMVGPALLLFLGLRAYTLAQLDGPLSPPDPMVNPLAHVSVAERLLSAVFIYAYALRLTLAPFRLASDYGLAVFPILQSAWDPRFLGALLALLAILGVGLEAARRHVLLCLAAASFLGFSFLTSNIPLVIGTSFGERLLYAPSLGMCFAVAWALRSLPSRPASLAALALLVAWLGTSAWTAHRRCYDWRDDQTLYSRDLQTQPRSARLHYHAADHALLQGDRERQFHHMAQAFSLKPERIRAWLRLAWFFQRQARFEEAHEALARGLASATGEDRRYRFHLLWTLLENLEASGSRETRDVRRGALAATDALLGSAPERAALRERLAENAPAVRTWLLAARALEEAGRPAAAEQALREGLAASSEAGLEYRFNLHWNRVKLLEALGDRAAAREALGEALRADPAAFRERLALVWSLRGRGWPAADLRPLFEAGARLEPGESRWLLYADLVTDATASPPLPELAQAGLDPPARAGGRRLLALMQLALVRSAREP